MLVSINWSLLILDLTSCQPFQKIKLMTTVLEWGLHSLEWECLQEQAKQKDEDENEQ